MTSFLEGLRTSASAAETQPLAAITSSAMRAAGWILLGQRDAMKSSSASIGGVAAHAASAAGELADSLVEFFFRLTALVPSRSTEAGIVAYARTETSSSPP